MRTLAGKIATLYCLVALSVLCSCQEVRHQEVPMAVAPLILKVMQDTVAADVQTVIVLPPEEAIRGVTNRQDQGKTLGGWWSATSELRTHPDIRAEHFSVVRFIFRDEPPAGMQADSASRTIIDEFPRQTGELTATHGNLADETHIIDPHSSESRLLSPEDVDYLEFSWRGVNQRLWAVERTIRRELSTATEGFATALFLDTHPLWFGQVFEVGVRFHVSSRPRLNFDRMEFGPAEEQVFKGTRTMVIDKEARPCFLTTVPSTLWTSLTPQRGTHIRVGCGFPGNPGLIEANTLSFRLIARDRVQFRETVLVDHDMPVGPAHRKMWHDFDLELSEWANTPIDLLFEVSSQSPLTSPTVAWSQPCMVNSDSHTGGKTFNVVLASLDTLRWDWLGASGCPENLSPWLDRFSRQSLQMTTAISHSPATTPSHASMLTGLEPLQHGVIQGLSRLSDRIPTLATILMRHGWLTGAVTGGARMGAYTGLNQGFYHYSVRDQRVSSLEAEALPWLRTVGRLPFFLFYHTYHVHAPYRADDLLTPALYEGWRASVSGYETFHNPRNAPLDDVQRRDLTAMYKTNIRELDAALGKLFIFLEQHASLAQSLVIVTADHGEHFGEREGLYGHCNSLYDELLRVPLFIKFPDAATRRGLKIEQAGLTSIVPTILDVLDLAPLTHVAAPSLLAPVPEDVRDGVSFVFSEIDTAAFPAAGIAGRFSVRHDRWKLIVEGQGGPTAGSLFKVGTSTDEPVPLLIDADPTVIPVLRQAADAYAAQRNRHRKSADTAHILQDHELTQELKALGYIVE